MTIQIPRPYVPFGRILLGGLATVIAAVAANLIVRWLLMAILPIATEFPPFSASAIVAFTTTGAILATVIYWVITRVSFTPVRTFRIVAVVTLILSIIPNLLAVINPALMPMPFPGASSLAYGALVVFHVVAALICMYVLPAVARPLITRV